MPARTKKPAPPAPDPSPSGPDLTVPTPRAGKPDTSIVTYYRPGRAFVSYTDRDGTPHGEECAAEDVRATTVRLAKAFGKAA